MFALRSSEASAPRSFKCISIMGDSGAAQLSREVGAGGGRGGQRPSHFYCTGGIAPPPTSYTNARILAHAINPFAHALDLFPTAHGRICHLNLFIATTPLLSALRAVSCLEGGSVFGGFTLLSTYMTRCCGI